jgi:D-arabinose 1-dehydrogenase-like Zn-dependent alcohol dehydrogenase
METLTTVRNPSERRAPARRVEVGVQASACPGNTLKRELQQVVPETGAPMLAAVITAPGEVRCENGPIPQPRNGEVRVQLEGCGVCGSNLAPWEGRPWFNYPLAPGELGHEGWGIVDEIGANVSQISVGDHVALLSYRAYAEYDIAPETSVVRLPRELDGQPFPGEALGCAMNVFRRADIFPGQTVGIVGIGFLGAVLTALCSNAGANVIAISRRTFALEIARKMGATETFSLGAPASRRPGGAGGGGGGLIL